MDLMTRRRAMLAAAAVASGLRYDLRTVRFTASQGAVTIPRLYQDFILLAEVAAAPETIAANTSYGFCFTYCGQFMTNAGYVLSNAGSSGTVRGVAINPSKLIVRDETIALSPATSHNAALVDWNVLQIELPTGHPFFSFRT